MKNLETKFIDTLELINKQVSDFTKTNNLKVIFKIINLRLALVCDRFSIDVDLYNVSNKRFSLSKENYKQIYNNYFKDNENSLYNFYCETEKSMQSGNGYAWTETLKLEYGLNKMNKFIKAELLKNL